MNIPKWITKICTPKQKPRKNTLICLVCKQEIAATSRRDINKKRHGIYWHIAHCYTIKRGK